MKQTFDDYKQDVMTNFEIAGAPYNVSDYMLTCYWQTNCPAREVVLYYKKN